MVEKTTGQQRPGFKPGQSGNPAGRPRGARHRVTVLAEKLMGDDAESVVRSVIAAAQNGDMTAAKIVLDRIAPPRKGSVVSIDLPRITSAENVVAAMAQITEATAAGEITTDEGQALAALVEGQRRAIETAQLEQRIAALEAQAGEQH